MVFLGVEHHATTSGTEMFAFWRRNANVATSLSVLKMGQPGYLLETGTYLCDSGW